MSNLAYKIPYSADDYLHNEALADSKHEYVDGEVYAMAGASERHNRIAGNAFFALRSAVRGSPCAAYISDMKLRLQQQNSFYYPDVMLCCDPDDDHPLYKTRPCILIEVLSPSTVSTDQREKWLAYRQLDSLRAYLMVDCELRRVDYALRDEQDAWLRGRLAENEVLHLPCGRMQIALSLDDLYEDVSVPLA
jgi:Uma2 family endonuclease